MHSNQNCEPFVLEPNLGPLYKNETKFASLHPKQPIAVREDVSVFQEIICRGKSGRTMLVQFMMRQGFNRHEPVGPGWDEFSSLAKRYHKNAEPVKESSKKMCKALLKGGGECQAEEKMFFHGFEITFMPPMIESCIEACFVVFFHGSNTFATFTCVYLSLTDELVVWETKYHRSSGETKQVRLAGDDRKKIFKKIEKLCLPRAHTHTLF